MVDPDMSNQGMVDFYERNDISSPHLLDLPTYSLLKSTILVGSLSSLSLNTTTNLVMFLKTWEYGMGTQCAISFHLEASRDTKVYIEKDYMRYSL